MSRSDFIWVNFDHNFTAAAPTVTKTFLVHGYPFDTGYLLIQARDVEHGSHQISINNKQLPAFDIPPDSNNQWQTWMDRIPPDYLHTGQNIITINRTSRDDFLIANVAIHWRERTTVAVLTEPLVLTPTG